MFIAVLPPTVTAALKVPAGSISITIVKIVVFTAALALTATAAFKLLPENTFMVSEALNVSGVVLWIQGWAVNTAPTGNTSAKPIGW